MGAVELIFFWVFFWLIFWFLADIVIIEFRRQESELGGLTMSAVSFLDAGSSPA